MDDRDDTGAPQTGRAAEGVPGEQDLVDGGLSLPDEIFEVDGDTTGADPDADDPAVRIRPHEPGHLT